MKLLKHLAIYTSLALNAFGGWHDTAPYVAWPATNHLRWVDNVGVYTNASNPTNSGYGAWTNNYTNQLIYVYDDGIDYFNTSYMLTTGDWVYVSTSNWLMNAKDVRSVDCVDALVERHIALGGSVSNFWEEMLGYDVPMHSWFYRNEVQNIMSVKDYISRKLSSFYYTTNNWDSATNLTASALAVLANVPTNFLAYTPARAADGSWTHYQRILTNTFILRQGTNAAHVATNSLVDSAGIDFTAVGTNGLSVTRYATNVNQQAGSNLGAYGWDGLRRVISNLVATAYTGGWTNNGTTNSWVGYNRQRPPGSPGQVIFFPGETETAWTNAHANAYTNLLNMSSNVAAIYPTENNQTLYGSDGIGQYVDAIWTITRSFPYVNIPTNGFASSIKFYGKTSPPLNVNGLYRAFNFGKSNLTWFAVGSGTNTAGGYVVGNTNAPPFFIPELSERPPLDPNQYPIGWFSTEAKAIAIWDFDYK